jgi:hypothetical protein
VLIMRILSFLRASTFVIRHSSRRLVVTSVAVEW